MQAPADIKEKKAVASSEDRAAEERNQTVAHSRKALSLLDQLRLTPNPENYALFFHYALAMNPELVRELDAAIANKVPLTPSVLKNLYNKYVVANNNQRLINEVTQGANRMLSEVLRIVGEFNKQTSSYTQDIDGFMKKISDDIEDPNLKGLVRQLIESTASIKERGESLNNKLQESKLEIESLRKNLDQVTQESQRDFLTGVFNRKSMDHMLAEYMSQCSDEAGQELCMLMIDVDYFKQFNDKFGHLLGDEVLKIVARAITYCVRGKDIVSRYGGEEFCVLLPGTPLMGAAKVAENIRSTIATRDLKRKDTGESYGSITVSVGAAQLKASDTPESLIARADESLYKSKAAGRNRVTTEETGA